MEIPGVGGVSGSMLSFADHDKHRDAANNVLDEFHNFKGQFFGNSVKSELIEEQHKELHKSMQKLMDLIHGSGLPLDKKDEQDLKDFVSFVNSYVDNDKKYEQMRETHDNNLGNSDFNHQMHNPFDNIEKMLSKFAR